MKYLISQNTDGIHRKSGIPEERLSELHGSTSLEHCKKCGLSYYRDFYTENEDERVEDHSTGRKCDDSFCRGILFDNIVHFGEDLPKKALELAYENAK